MTQYEFKIMYSKRIPHGGYIYTISNTSNWSIEMINWVLRSSTGTTWGYLYCHAREELKRRTPLYKVLHD